MLITRIRYFVSVVRNNSFSKAADENFISQSAISQQIRALEDELGVELLKRSGRGFTLTPAGEVFYRKGLVLLDEADRLVRDTKKAAEENRNRLNIGWPMIYSTDLLMKVLPKFRQLYPEIEVTIRKDTHDGMGIFATNGELHCTVNDQRKLLSEEAHNYYLGEEILYAEVSPESPLACLKTISADDLRRVPCILVSSLSHQTNEKNFYQQYFRLAEDVTFAESLEGARVKALSGEGYVLSEGETNESLSLVRIPVVRNDEVIRRKYYVFYRDSVMVSYVEKFAELLKEEMVQSKKGII